MHAVTLFQQWRVQRFEEEQLQQEEKAVLPKQ
jgi:hypothetical protein